MDYTKLNLKEDVQDQAEGFGLAPDLEARFATDALGMQKGGVGYERFAPGFRMPFGHTHGEQEEVYVVLSGGGRMKVEDEIFEVGRLDAIRVAAGAWRCFEADADGAELLAFGAPHVEDRQAEAEMKPGWWSD